MTNNLEVRVNRKRSVYYYCAELTQRFNKVNMLEACSISGPSEALTLLANAAR